MIAGIVLVAAILVLVVQVMDPSTSGARPDITIASQFNIPADRVFTGWPVLDQPLHVVTDDIQIWILMILAAAVIYWVADWSNEKLSALYKRTPPAAEAKLEHP
jgi:hypothetical protein